MAQSEREELKYTVSKQYGKLLSNSNYFLRTQRLGNIQQYDPEQPV